MPRPASIAPICITRTYIHTYLSIASFRRSRPLPRRHPFVPRCLFVFFCSSPVVPRRTAPRRPTSSGLFSRTRKDGEYALRRGSLLLRSLLFRPTAASLCQSHPDFFIPRSYFRLSLNFFSSFFSSFFCPSPLVRFLPFPFRALASRRRNFSFVKIARNSR